MSDENRLEAAKEQLAKNRASQEKIRETQEAVAQGKPTPTQEENDLARLGAHILEHEPDGSPEQPPFGVPPDQPQSSSGLQTRQVEARRGQAPYQTRAATPQPPHRPASD